MAAVNDATKQKIGDIYQYFIALFDCFSLKKGESMLIETEGDVSIVSHSGQNRVQKEIKQGFFHAISFKYLYAVGLLIPHTLASSDTFIFPSRKAA